MERWKENYILIEEVTLINAKSPDTAWQGRGKVASSIQDREVRNDASQASRS